MSDFKSIIKTYLDKRSSEDELFAKAYAKENKNIDECCAYIMGEAKKKAQNGCAAIDDATVFGWAVHYYDEDSIKINKNAPKAAVSVPKTEKSVQKVEKKPKLETVITIPEKKKTKPGKTVVPGTQMNLFDF